MSSILNAPVNLYFDITPIGKTLNKFSKDMVDLECGLGWCINGNMSCVYSIIQVIFISTYAVYQVSILYPIMAIVSYFIMKKSIISIKETARLSSTTKSPHVSFLTESINGISTIRAFNLGKNFEEENNRLLNNIILATQMQIGVNMWFKLRVDLMVLAFNIVLTTVCVMVRE